MSNLKLQALICIINPDLENNLVEMLNQNNARGINILLGHGAKKFHLLEFHHNHKSIIVSFIKAETEKTIMQMLIDHNFVGKEKGIAFTINIDAAAGGKSIFNFYDKVQTYLKEKNPEEIFDEEITGGKDTGTAVEKMKESDETLQKSDKELKK